MSSHYWHLPLTLAVVGRFIREGVLVTSFDCQLWVVAYHQVRHYWDAKVSGRQWIRVSTNTHQHQPTSQVSREALHMAPPLSHPTIVPGLSYNRPPHLDSFHTMFLLIHIMRHNVRWENGKWWKQADSAIKSGLKFGECFAKMEERKSWGLQVVLWFYSL